MSSRNLDLESTFKLEHDYTHAVESIRHPRILHIASGDLWAGAEVQMFTLVRALHDTLQVPVNVVLLNHGRLEQQLSDAGIRVCVLDESRLNAIQILYRLVQIIRQLSPDVIHTHRQKENILGSVAALISGRVASLRTTHGAPESRPPRWKIQKRIFSLLDWLSGRYLQKKIIAVSDDLAVHLKKMFPEERIHVIENGIDLLEVNKTQEKAGLSSDTLPDIFRIGIAGRLVPVKRVDLFIQTARYIRDHHPDLHASFHIFGDGPLRTRLESLSQTINTTDLVHFEGHCDDMHQRLKSLNILLTTSDHEGLPMILLEAMALRTPIIAHAVGGIPKLLDQGSCGVLVHGQRASDYANAVYELAKSPRICKEITTNAYNRVITNYSAESNARNYLSEYSSILHQRR